MKKTIESEAKSVSSSNKGNSFFTIGIGILMLLYFVFHLCRCLDTYRWIEVPCNFQKIDEEIISGGDSSDDMQRRYVVYSYTMDGKDYISDKTYVGLLFFSNGRGLTPEIEEQYKSKKGRCYVNPLFHSDTVLIKGAENEYPILMASCLFGIISIFAGLSIMYKGI